MRPSGRQLDELRPVSIETNVTKHAEGSCMIRMGDTHVLCTATLEDRVPSSKALALVGSLPNTACCRARPRPACDVRQHLANKVEEPLKFKGL